LNFRTELIPGQVPEIKDCSRKCRTDCHLIQKHHAPYGIKEPAYSLQE